MKWKIDFELIDLLDDELIISQEIIESDFELTEKGIIQKLHTLYSKRYEMRNFSIQLIEDVK